MKNIFLFLFLLLSFVAPAQEEELNTEYLKKVHSYKTAVGVKLLGGAGLSLKHFIRDGQAVDLLIAFQRNGSRLTGLYQIHGDLQVSTGLKWYVGPGAHVSFTSSKTDPWNYVGIDGVLGLDYKFPIAPVNISVDVQPSYEFGKGNPYRGLLAGFAIRYTF